jgi:flagellar biosynthesis GTPase FlhF
LPTLVGPNIKRVVVEFLEEFRGKKVGRRREKEEQRRAEEEEKERERAKSNDKKESKKKASTKKKTKDDEDLADELHNQQVDDEDDDNIATANTSRQDAPFYESDHPSSPTPSSPDHLSSLGFMTAPEYLSSFTLPLVRHYITSVLIQPIPASYASNHAALAAQAECAFRDETEVKQWLENWRESGMVLGVDEHGFLWDGPQHEHHK